MFPIFLTPEYSKFDPNIIGLYIKFPILVKPKNLYICSYLTVSLLKSIDFKPFLGRICKKLCKTFIKKIYGFLGTTASYISLLKSKQFLCAIYCDQDDLNS